MNTFRYVLMLHVLGASVWAGGHLVLALSVLPRALRAGDAQIVHDFESTYERVGLPALVVQVVTGLWLAHRLLPSVGDWFAFDSTLSTLLGLKLIALGCTLGLAMHARLKLIPQLDEHTLKPLAVHIVAVTLLAVFMLVLGVGFRTGGLY